MAAAQHIRIHNNNQVKYHLSGNFLKIGKAAIQRVLWHTKAYTTVLGIMLLTFASLGFLYIDWFWRKILPTLDNQQITEEKWKADNSK